MLMMLALLGPHAQKGPTDAHDALMLALSGPHASKGPTDAHDALVRPSRPARGQVMLMMLALSGCRAQQGAN